MGKILIVTPDEGKLTDHVVRSIAKQHCPPGVTRIDHSILRDFGPSDRTKVQRVADQFNHARELMLSGGYDAMMSWENDIITNERDLVCKLWEVDADVVHALYCFRKPGAPWNLSMLDGMKSYHLSSFPDRTADEWGKVVPIDGYGMGCTLIRRPVLERLRFRSSGLLHEDGAESHCDWYFTIDLLQMTIGMASSRPVVKGHLGVKVGHIHHHPEPHILYPVPHHKAMDPRFPFVAMPFGWLQDVSTIPTCQRERQYQQLRLMGTETSEYLDLIYNEASKVDALHSILEIGVNYGVSTTALLAGKPSPVVLLSVDVASCERARERLQESLVWDWTFIKSDSIDINTLEYVRTRHANVGLLLIDGLHTYQQVYSELVLYESVVDNHGVILVHDVLLYEGVAKAVSDFCHITDWRAEIVPGHCGMAVLRRPENEV